MYKNKKILAIIPARSGSKEIKDKNILKINRIPLLAYSILCAKKSNIFDYIIVSTDSRDYADISINYGASVPFLRPNYLASDTSTTSSVIEHTLDKLKNMGLEFDYFVLLQPTSPLRKVEDIVNCVDLVIDNSINCVVSVCKIKNDRYLEVNLDNNMMIDSFTNNHRRQDYDTKYKLNGAVYACCVDYYLKHLDFYKNSCMAYIMDSISSIDIDGMTDFLLVKSILESDETNLYY